MRDVQPSASLMNSKSVLKEKRPSTLLSRDGTKSRNLDCPIACPDYACVNGIQYDMAYDVSPPYCSS